MKKTQITIVDDNRGLGEALKEFLLSVGFSVDVYSSATDYLSSNSFTKTSCLIADISMPGIDGLELQRRLTSAGHRIPTIFMTAFYNDAIRKSAEASDAICLLGKPFEEDELLGCIEMALRGNGGILHDHAP